MSDAAEAKHQARCLEQISWNDEDGDAWLTPDCELKGFGPDSLALALAAAGAEIDRLQRELDGARRVLAGYREERRLRLERISPTPRYEEPIPDDIWRKLHGENKP